MSINRCAIQVKPLFVCFVFEAESALIVRESGAARFKIVIIKRVKQRSIKQKPKKQAKDNPEINI